MSLSLEMQLPVFLIVGDFHCYPKIDADSSNVSKFYENSPKKLYLEPLRFKSVDGDGRSQSSWQMEATSVYLYETKC